MTEPEIPMTSANVPVIGIDPGARWTAAVLVVGEHPVTGWTLGPVDVAGRLAPAALDNPDDLAALSRYLGRLLAGVEELAERAEREYGQVRIGVETIRVPPGWRHGRGSRVDIADWLTPRSVAVAVMALYPDARMVLPAKHGARPRMDYPTELRRRRPPGWGPNEARSGERDHERSAYDVAAAAAKMP